MYSLVLNYDDEMWINFNFLEHNTRGDGDNEDENH